MLDIAISFVDNANPVISLQYLLKAKNMPPKAKRVFAAADFRPNFGFEARLWLAAAKLRDKINAAKFNKERSDKPKPSSMPIKFHGQHRETILRRLVDEWLPGNAHLASVPIGDIADFQAAFRVRAFTADVNA